jgi:molybdate transport system substrate-binding protein
MIKPMRKLALVAFLIAHVASAQVRVLASNGIKAALEALKPEAEKAAGHPVMIQYGSSAGLKRMMEAGEVFDLAIVTPEATADLIKSGKIASGSAVDVAHTGIGFGARAGGKKMDVSTPEAAKQALLKASSIAVVKEGASRVAIDRMFDRLGIASAVASKTTFEAGTIQSGQKVADGHSDLEIIPLSEIPLVPGVDTLGPLPGDLQVYLHFQASLSANAKDAAAAKKVIQALLSPSAAPIFKAKGMEPK